MNFKTLENAHFLGFSRVLKFMLSRKLVSHLFCEVSYKELKIQHFLDTYFIFTQLLRNYLKEL